MARVLLLMNHSEPLRRQAETAFADEGLQFSIETADSAVLDKIQQQPPDVIVLELWDESGWTLVNALRNGPKTASLPLIITLEDHSAADRARSIDGPTVVLNMPFDWEDLIYNIKQFMPSE